MNLSRAATQNTNRFRNHSRLLAVELPVTKAIVARGGFQPR
jgi:hypothetical protein